MTLHVQSLSILYCGVTIYLVSNINCGLFNYVHLFCIVQSCILKLTNFKFGSNVNNRMYNLINHVLCFGIGRRRQQFATALTVANFFFFVFGGLNLLRQVPQLIMLFQTVSDIYRDGALPKQLPQQKRSRRQIPVAKSICNAPICGACFPVAAPSQTLICYGKTAFCYGTSPQQTELIFVVCVTIHVNT